MIETLTEKSGRVRQAVKYSSSSRARKKDDVIVLDGIHLVREALSKLGASSLVSFFVTEESFLQPEIEQIIGGIDEREGTRKGAVVSSALMRSIAATVTPQGILAVFMRPQGGALNDESYVLALENVQDPTNVGAMIRSAAALGVEAIILSKDCADAWSPRALRASQGAHFYTNIIPDVGLAQMIGDFDGRAIATVLSDTASSLYECDLTGKIMIVMGNEGLGVTPAVSKLCDHHIIIPMSGNFESLNVSNACAIVCAEKSRQDQLK